MCKNEFPRLDEHMEACGKCKARKSGMSTTEYAVINVCNLVFIWKKNSNDTFKRINLSVVLVEWFQQISKTQSAIAASDTTVCHLKATLEDNSSKFRER